MRTLNVRLAAICLSAVVLSGGGVHALHEFQVYRHAKALRVASERAEEEKNFTEAVRLLNSYVRLMPKDREAELHLGLLYAHSDSPSSPPLNAVAAVLTLEDVLRKADSSLSQEDLRKARRRLVDIAPRIGRLSDAEAHLAELMKETPNDPELLDLAAQLRTVDNKYEEAEREYRKAIENAPTQIDTYPRLAYVLRRLNRQADADKVMYDMVHHKVKVTKDGKVLKDKDGKDVEVEVNAKSVEAVRKYAHYLREQGKYDEALVETKQVLELKPEDSVGLWIAGCCCLTKGQYKTGEEAKGLYKAAEDYLNRGIKADKSSKDLYTVMSDVKNRLGRHDEAVAVLRQGLENTKGTGGYAEILWDLANSNILVDRKFDVAEMELKELRDLHYKPQRVKFLEARLALMKGDWNAAEAAFVDVLPKLHDDPNDRDIQRFAYLHLGQCYRQQGRPDKQMVACTEALKIDPYLSQARAGLAEIFMSQGKFVEAADQYRQMYQAPHPDLEAAFSLARTMILMRVSESKELRDWEPVDKLLNSIERQRSLSPNLAVLKAEVLLAKDRSKDDGVKDPSREAKDPAQDYLEKCSKKFPKSVQIWQALINLAMYRAEKETASGQKEQKWKQASDYIDRAEQNLGDLPSVREKRGSCAVRRKDSQASAVLKKLGEHVDKMTDPEKMHLWGSLYALSVQANDLDLARSYCRLVAKNDAKNVQIRYLLCDLDLRVFEKGKTPDLQELDARLDEIEHLGGRGAFWLYGKAVGTLVQSGKTDPQLLLDARRYAQEALTVRKDWSAPAVLAGKICEMQEEPDQALEFYHRAVFHLGERDSDVIRRTVQLLVAHGSREDIDEARQLFAVLEKQKSSLLGEMSSEYAFVKVLTGNIAEAAVDVEKSVPADSKNYKDFLRQGQMYALLARRLKFSSRGGETGAETTRTMARQALVALFKARTLDPQAGEVWTAIVQLLTEMGAADEARPLVADAEKTLKGEKAPLTLAVCYELLRETEKARAKYEAAAGAMPKNSRVLRQAAAFYLRNAKRDLAEPLLQQVVALQTPATLTDACWARRNLAAILRSRGDFDHLLQGKALIEENLHSKAASTDDKREMVRFLVADPRREKIGEAIQAMEDLVKAADVTPDDYFILAKLYLKKGDWISYEDRMHSVLGGQKGVVQPAHLVFYINSLMEKNHLDDADKWLQTLEKTAPNLFDTVQLRADYQFLRGNAATSASQASVCYKAAGDLAMAFLDNPLAQPPNRGQQLYLVARLMERFSDRLKAEGKEVVASGFAEKANTLFVSLRSKRVAEAGEIYFVDYLARQKRIHECLKVLEQCWDKYPAEALQIPAEMVIHSKAADAAQHRQLEKILAAASGKANNPIGLSSLLADLHAELGQYDVSIADYREVLRKDPRNYRALNNLSVSLARTGQNLDEALKLVNDALAIKGPLAEVLDSRAIVYIARQEYEKALEDLAAAIKDDGTAEQYFHQAWAYSLAGKRNEAMNAFAAAMKKGLDAKNLDPREVPVYDRMRDGM